MFKEDTTFRFSLYKENGDTLKKSYHVKVKSPLIAFQVPASVYKGTNAYLYWEVKKGFFVKITGTGQTITKLKGKVKIPLDEEKKYTLTIKDQDGKLIYRGVKKIEHVKSLIRQFRVPELAVEGSPTKIYWELINGYTASIEGVKSRLPHKGKIEIVPIESRAYTLVVLRAGKEVERKELPMEVIKRRSFVKQVKNFSELGDDAELNFEIFSIDESNYPNEVKLYVLAVDGQGNFVKGLERENKNRQKKIVKRIIEKSGKEKRKISDFKFKEYEDVVSLPYDISMALDYSGSMFGTIKKLEKAVHTFISNKNKNDKIAIARFDHNLVKVNDLEGNADSLLKYFTIKGLDTLGGGTALYSGSDFAMDLTDSSQNNKVLIIFTDGMENSSFQYFGKYAYSATALAKKAKKEGVTIHVIAYKNGVNNSVLRKLAYTTGGNFYKLNSPSDINAVFEELPIIFRNYYVISYRPTKRKGKHSIRMIYDNLQDEDVTIQTDYQVGDKFIIDENEPSFAKTYWAQAADSLNKTPVSVPQAVANFDFDKDKLLDNYKKSIDAYIEYLKTMEDASVIIFGHTDSKGNDKYCYELSERRANTIKEYMLEQGIAAEKIFVIPCGKSQMIWYPEDKEWKAKENRRIEILLLK
jgi:VWFA-related protein